MAISYAVWIRKTFFNNSFFPSTVIEWNKLNPNLRNENSLQFIRPSLNSFFNWHNPKGIKLVTRLRTGLSHLREHKLKHSFQDSLKPICRCGNDVKSCVYYFLRCPLFQNEGLILLSVVKNIDSKLLDSKLLNLRLTQILLFGDTSLDVNTNSSILTQPSISLYHPRDLKNHFFSLPIFSSAQLVIFTRI